MSPWLKQNVYLIYSFVLGLYLVNVFVGSEIAAYIIGALTIPMLLFSLLGATRLFKTLGCLFILLGSFLFFQSGLHVREVLPFMTTNLGLLALLTMLPWMNSVVRAGRFDRRINELMKTKVTNLGKLYSRATLTAFTLASFINLSALPLTQGVLLQNLSNLPKRLRDTFISQTTLRAFSMALVWSPMEIMVAISVDATGVSYLTYLPWLILFSMIMIFLDLMWGKKAYQDIPYDTTQDHIFRNSSMKQIFSKIGQLFLALVVFLTLIVTISMMFHLNFILIVTLVIFPFACLWAFVIKRWRSFLSIGWQTWKDRTNKMENFIVLFVSLGFFSNSLNYSPLLGVIQHPFVAIADYPILILFFIQFTYLVLSMFGIHPIATIGVLMEVVTPLYEVMNPLSIGLVLITGALATATVGTYGVTVTITSMNTNQNPYLITLKNMPFALVYGTVGTLLAFLLL